METERTNGSAACIQDDAAAFVALHSVEFLLPAMTLALLNAVVLLGNTLVILAVLTTQKLRTVTNTFIISLAVADLLLGIFVLPFSSTNELLRYWVFGPVWCSVWLAVDVWLSTASIMNLCAISLDRYLAISRPFKYHSLMSPRRGKILVGLVWVTAFVVCFPPLIGWNERGEALAELAGKDKYNGTVPPSVVSIELSPVSRISSNYTYMVYNYSYWEQEQQNKTKHCDSQYPQCTLTSDPGYIIYSAMGSFYIPMCIMVTFYWRIYRTAVKTTSALKRGVLTTKTGGDLSSANGQKSVTLRVHRGGGGGGAKSPANSTSSVTNPLLQVESNCHHSSVRRKPTVKREQQQNTPLQGRRKNNISPQQPRRPQQTSKISLFRFMHSYGRSFKSLDNNPALEGSQQPRRGKHKRHPRLQRLQRNRYNESVIDRGGGREEEDAISVDGRNNTLIVRAGRKNIKTQLRRLNKETKAAKTVGIIVGCFIVCWLPFFTIYLMGAWCVNCTPPLVFSVFFWLGYCNSAVNPCVYALFSKDFRYAFKRLLCCRAEERQRRRGVLSTMSSLRIPMSSRGSDSNSE